MNSRAESGIHAVTAGVADCYSRLHRRLVSPQALVDPSWGCELAQQGSCLRWGAQLCRKPGSTLVQQVYFSSFLQRFALLTPPELQKILCACVLLSRREKFRHCIDGVKIRALQALIGSASMAALMASKTTHRAPVGSSDWCVESLLSEGFAHVERASAGQPRMLLDLIRLGLPRQLAVVSSVHDAGDFEALVREVHQWYPEFTWLFG